MQNLNLQEIIDQLQFSDDCVAEIPLSSMIQLFSEQVTDELKKTSAACLIALAALYQSKDLLDILGLDINVCNETEEQATALMICCANNNLHAVQFLIDAGADVNFANSFGDMPLPLAIFFGHLEVVKLLLAAHANPNIRLEDGSSPLDVALLGFLDSAEQSAFSQLNQVYIDITEVLINAGADALEQNESGFTVLDELNHAEQELMSVLKDDEIELSEQDKKLLYAGIQETITMLGQFKKLYKTKLIA